MTREEAAWCAEINESVMAGGPNERQRSGIKMRDLFFKAAQKTRWMTLSAALNSSLLVLVCFERRGPAGCLKWICMYVTARGLQAVDSGVWGASGGFKDVGPWGGEPAARLAPTFVSFHRQRQRVGGNTKNHRQGSRVCQLREKTDREK